jgi:hypothetical protein
METSNLRHDFEGMLRPDRRLTRCVREAALHPRSGDRLDFAFCQPESQRFGSHQQRIFAQDGVAKWQDVVRLGSYSPSVKADRT